eukprot:4173968-Prymnesium_polylepis.1
MKHRLQLCGELRREAARGSPCGRRLSVTSDGIVRHPGHECATCAVGKPTDCAVRKRLHHDVAPC